MLETFRGVLHHQPDRTRSRRIFSGGRRLTADPGSGCSSNPKFGPGRRRSDGALPATMMQMSDSYNQKNSLFTAMSRFIGAVNNMDQTVMVPSLLRDVPLDDGEDLKAPQTAAAAAGSVFLQQDGDMYSSYVLLKSIRNDMEWGVLQGDERPKQKVEEVKREAEEEDLEKQFRFHLNGLHTVLSKLTLKANTLTNRYKEEIGCRN